MIFRIEGSAGVERKGILPGKRRRLPTCRRFLWAKSSLASPLPGIVAGAILCFILAMNAYAKPVLLGGDSGAVTAFVPMTAALLPTASADLLMPHPDRHRLGGRAS